jgi:hypothetical protein
VSGYRGMTPDEFVDYLIDENGLAEFVDAQVGRATDEERPGWDEIAHRIWYLSANQWQPTQDYVASLYAAQCERIATKAKAA